MGVLTGKKAPLFTAPAVINGNETVDAFKLEDYIGKKYIVLFFYPADFTFVCPTEILAFQDKMEEFDKRDVQVIGVSTDSQFSHWKWLQTELNDGGIKGVKYPLVADQSKIISMDYDVLAGEYDWNEEGNLIFEGTPMAYRGLFLIDKEGVVQHQVVNNMPLGRSISETLRMVDALQYFEKHGEVCPADWHEGEEALVPTHEGIAEFLAKK
ncbi:MAG: peroxiredoxin [Chlorobi bacterium]|nr:peroxiredoxin [Chlorobiota bacterium]